ncbi:MAG TPA: YicC/YloC family endoribonuclease [Bryobacteraceae bacterium]|nr:YicC/YloC family endoribonuclease [Bryobacteraceae bacterium]
MSVRSMTGFAQVRKSVREGEIVLSVKTVNHRGLDMHLHLPPEMDAFESAMRKAIKGRVARGHLQLNVAWNRVNGAAADSSLNRPLLEAYLEAFERAQREFHLAGTPDLNVAFRIPGMFRAETVPDLSGTFESSLVATLEEALASLNRFREREGAEIASEILERCGKIRHGAGRMEEIRSGAVQAFQKRLNERLSELLRGASVEPHRLAQEAAVLADRSDISEELIRLKTHASELEQLVRTGGEIGKKLDFLLQEMNRETNTILSKTGGLGDLGLTITELALAAKSEIDKIREQSLNLE